jgi:hypothetical protein
VRNARKSDSEKHGDAIVEIDGQQNYVEIKFTTKSTINQIRAVKFIPLAIYSPQKPLPWAVLSAVEVVRLVHGKSRGQHNELALECAALTLSGLPPSSRYSDSQLSDAVHEAIRSARRYPELAATLNALMARLTATKTEYREKVRVALTAGDGR